MAGMKDMGLLLTDDEFFAFFHELDADGDGAITSQEFCTAIGADDLDESAQNIKEMTVFCIATAFLVSNGLDDAAGI